MKKVGLMFVYNEAPKPGFESYLENSVNVGIESVRKSALNQLIIYDDGSKDNSYEFVKEIVGNEPNIILMRNKFNINKGKAKVFLKGLEKGAEMGAEVLVTLDSDLAEFYPENILQLTEGLSPSIDMVIGNHYYKNEDKKKLFADQISYSGLRAIKIDALKGLWGAEKDSDLIKKFKYWGAKNGFRLECILNEMIPSQKRCIIDLKDAKLREKGKGRYNLDEINKAIINYYWA